MIKLDQILKVVSLEKHALSAASRFSGLPKLEDTIEPYHAVMLVLCDILHQKGFDKDHQYAILEVIKADVCDYMKHPEQRLMGVQILDYNYVALPGWKKPYDYKALDFIDALPLPPVTSDCIALNAIYQRLIKPILVS